MAETEEQLEKQLSTIMVRIRNTVEELELKEKEFKALHQRQRVVRNKLQELRSR